MKEVVSLIFRLKLKELFAVPTNNAALQGFRYLFVGGAAALVDWAVLFILEFLGLHYLLATCVAFIAGLIVNFALSKALVFKAAQARVKNKTEEFIGYALIGVIGLGLTELLMYLFTDAFGLYFMLSKMIATLIVLVWNFVARKFILYK